MRSILALFALVCLAGPALAGPGSDLAADAEAIAADAAARAETAAATPAAPADERALGDGFVLALEQFSVDALLLSRAIDEAGGPMDLRCIFRGMSEDAGHRLDRLGEAETAADRARVYREIEDLMTQAALMAPSADSEAGLESAPVPGGCPAAAAH